MMRLDAMILVFWILSFKPAFSLSCFTFIKRVFSPSLLSINRLVLPAYLRSLIDAFELLEKTLESPLDYKEIQPVHPKGNQSWIVIGRTDAEAETPILWLHDDWLIGKVPDAGKDWRREEKRTTEDEMVGWHHSLNGHGFGWTPGVGDGLGGLACCGSWGCKESDRTEKLNWTDIG